MKINLKEVFSTVSKFGDEHKPEIATGVGIVMMVAGAVGCVVATVKTMRAVADAKEEKLMAIAANSDEYENLTDEEQEEYDEIVRNPLPVKEAGKICWKYWIAPSVSIALGATSIIFSDKEQGRRIGLLTGALTSQIAEAKDYKEVVKEIVGKDKEQEIEEEQVHRKAKKSYDGGPENVFDTGTGSQLFYDYYSDRWIKASPVFMDSCLLELNKLIHHRYKKGEFADQFVTLNEWYDIVGIHTTGLGNDMGFPVTEEDVEFSSSYADSGITDEGYSYRVIKFRSGPEYIPYNL